MPRSLLGSVFCGGLACLLTYLLRDDPASRLAVPLLFMLVVIPTAHVCGALSATVGTVLASLTFAAFLFPPLGNLRVRDRFEQLILVLFQLGSICAAYLSARRTES